MPTRNLGIALVLVGSMSAFGGQPNPRFEGMWSGSETTRTDASIITKGEALKTPAQIAIGDSGRLLGVLKGLSPGRYVVSSEKSGGNVLVFSPRRDGPFWRTLTLSADGNTLVETGQATVTLESGARQSALSGRGPFKALGVVPVYGTFHRER